MKVQFKKLNKRLSDYILYRVFKVAQGQLIPIIPLIIVCILQPSRLLLLIAQKYSPVRYDIKHDTFQIYDVSFSGEFIKALRSREYRSLILYRNKSGTFNVIEYGEATYIETLEKLNERLNQ
jgi:hypothetical protein